MLKSPTSTSRVSDGGRRVLPVERSTTPCSAAFRSLSAMGIDESRMPRGPYLSPNRSRMLWGAPLITVIPGFISSRPTSGALMKVAG